MLNQSTSFPLLQSRRNLIVTGALAVQNRLAAAGAGAITIGCTGALIAGLSGYRRDRDRR